MLQLTPVSPTFNHRKRLSCPNISSNGDDHFIRKIVSQYSQWQKEDYHSCRVFMDLA